VKHKIGTLGFGKQAWPSLNRTLKFYETVLGSSFELHNADDGLVGDEIAIVSFGGNKAWQLSKNRDLPVLHVMHGGLILNYSILWDLFPLLYSSDTLLVNCKSDTSIAESFFTNITPNIYEIPLPVPTCFHALEREERLHRKYFGLSENDIVLGFVGRIVPQRNLHHFIRILASVKARVRNHSVKGLVVGQFWDQYPILDYKTSEYSQYISSLVRQLELENSLLYFPKLNTDSELAMAYASMDILVHPTNSIDENYGYVPIEAMATGTPVLGCAYGGLKDTIIHGSTGMLIDTWVTDGGIRTDFRLAEETICDMVSSKTLLNKMGQAARNHVKEVYSPEACAKQLLNSVHHTIEWNKCHTSRPVTMADLPAEVESQTLLPDKRWMLYSPSVSYYVSTDIYLPNCDDYVMLASPLKCTSDLYCENDDPAWPLRFKASLEQLELLHLCSQPVQINRLIRNNLIDTPSDLYHWIRMGVLIAKPS
jgi:glycosyltransferase involved in cell wall biosynthesis